jgi:thiamine biosynthesis lipoprotein
MRLRTAPGRCVPIGLTILIALGVAAACRDAGSARTLRDERTKMGTRFEIQIVSDDVPAGRAAIEAAYAEIDRVEQLLSEWRETSEISEVNREAGSRAVAVGPDLYAVLERAAAISEMTDGAFDVTFAACGGRWSIRERRIPADREIADCLAHVDFRRVELDPLAGTVYLPDEAMRIGISGIGKGYGVDRAAAVLEAHGVTDYIVDGGGDIRLAGANVDRPWVVGIADPRRHGQLYATVHPERGAIVTSGDYERYFEQDGVRYHHILDPETGRPARRSVAVTVIAPEATDADALATGLFVLGPERGMQVVESTPGVEALIFGPDLAIHRSSGFPEIRLNEAAGPGSR